MTQHEFEGRWERLGDKVESKWGKLTRAERNGIAGRRHLLHAKSPELYDISEGEVQRAAAVLGKARP